MGKKIDIKKIENSTKCQVTFSKRKSSLIKKSHEISVMCDVDVSFLAFSPSGRLTKFCSRNRIEDVIERYIDLPADKRYQQYYKSPMKNVEEKLEKLKMYDRAIKGDENKLQFLNNQIKHMELQVKKSSVELELFEVNLRDYEPDPSFNPSLAQLLWCEKNLKQSLHRLNDKKTMLFNLPTTNEQMRVQEQIERDVPFSNGENNDQLNWVSRNLNSSQPCSQLNPWNISPNYRSTKVGETSMVQELIGDQNGGKYGGNGALGVADNYMYNNNNQLPIIGYQSIQQSAGMPLLAPQPSVSTTTYSPILQHQGSTAEDWNIVHPNQQLGVLAISAMATDHTSNQNMNMNMNMNENLPLRNTITQLECEDFLNPNYIESDTNEKQLASDPTLIITNSIPPSDPDVQLLLPNCDISLEDLMGNDDKGTSSAAGNQEDDCSLEWDRYVLAENLINLDDLDFF